MSKRYDVVAPRKVVVRGEEKTYWNKIGSVFVGDDGKQQLRLESVPVGWDGFAIISEPTKKEEAQTRTSSRTPTGGFDDAPGF